MKKLNKIPKAPKWLRCIKKVDSSSDFSNVMKPCGEMLELRIEGDGKYDVYQCKHHGNISVHKGTRRR